MQQRGEAGVPPRRRHCARHRRVGGGQLLNVLPATTRCGARRATHAQQPWRPSWLRRNEGGHPRQHRGSDEASRDGGGKAGRDAGGRLAGQRPPRNLGEAHRGGGRQLPAAGGRVQARRDGQDLPFGVNCHGAARRNRHRQRNEERPVLATSATDAAAVAAADGGPCGRRRRLGVPVDERVGQLPVPVWAVPYRRAEVGGRARRRWSPVVGAVRVGNGVHPPVWPAAAVRRDHKEGVNGGGGVRIKGGGPGALGVPHLALDIQREAHVGGLGGGRRRQLQQQLLGRVGQVYEQRRRHGRQVGSGKVRERRY